MVLRAGPSIGHGCIPDNYCKRIEVLVGIIHAYTCRWVRSEYKKLSLGFGVLRFARQEGKRRGGHTWWVLAAGEWPGEDVPKGAAARPVVAARGERERERNRFFSERGRKMMG
jgi:hypothetical protein